MFAFLVGVIASIIIDAPMIAYAMSEDEKDEKTEKNQSGN
jgi:preprotein translocase subunit SecF